MVTDERAIWLGRHVLPHEAALRHWLRGRRLGGLDADDVVQETYARLIAAESVAHIRNARTYMFQTAGSVVGYAYAHTFNTREAYRWSCETSIYLASEARGNGGGRLLYESLLAQLRLRGYRRAYAGITQPNEASMALHRGVGFVEVGRFSKVGWKDGAWRDVGYWQLALQPLGDGAPAPPLPPGPTA